MNRRIRVAVLFGGRSGEHDVSIMSARSVLSALDGEKYDAAPVYVDPQGSWRSLDETRRVLALGRVASAHDQLAFPNGRPSLEPVAPVPPPALADRMAGVDVVFPLIHGTNGEDGTLQGLLELAGLPYVGAGVLGSAVSMDKAAMKDVFRQHGLPVGASLLVLRSRWRTQPGEVAQQVLDVTGYPCFVKPCNLGSSVGISKVHGPEGLAEGVDRAARYDRRILVEQFVDGRELECGVLGNDDPVASAPGEVIPGHEFYDYEAKYVDASSQLLIPAPLSAEQTSGVQRLAVAAFKAVDCAGMARVDFFLVGDDLYVNEINTLPGFTRISMYPKLWEASGLPYPDLLDRLVQLAIERHAEKAENVTTHRE